MYQGSWRREVGSGLVVAGLGVFVFGLVDMSLTGPGIINTATAWLCILLGPLIVLPGIGLHLTRSRRRTDIEVPPPAPGQHEPPHQPFNPPHT